VCGGEIVKKEKRLFSGTLLLGVSAALGKLLSLCLLPFFTARLTPEAFGITEIFVSTAVLLVPLFSLYAPQATFRFLAKGEKGATRMGAMLLGVGLFLLFCCIPLLGLFEALRPYRYLLYFYVCASLLRSFAAHVLRAEGHFGVFALQQSFCSLCTALLQILLLRTGAAGAVGYLLGIVLGDAITFLILLCCYFSQTKERERPQRVPCSRLLRFALPLIPAALFWWGIGAIEKYFLLYYHGAQSMGIYAVAGRFPTLIGFAVGIFLEVWHYAALQEEKGREGALFGRIYALILPLAIAAGVLVSVLSPLLISGTLASGYGDAERVVGLLCVGAVCAGLASFLDSVYALRLSSVWSMLTVAVSAFFNLLLSFLLVPRFGIVGAALCGTLSYALLFFLRLLHTARVLRFERHAKKSALSLLLLLSSGGLMALGRPIFATVLAVMSLLPVLDLLGDALLFLYKRTRVFLVYAAGFLKKEERI
jgi:O-antigen/teichoic acid export membrane protein